MAYIDGFVIPVKTADKQAFLDHAACWKWALRWERSGVENDHVHCNPDG